jgi:hypothetical protein
MSNKIEIETPEPEKEISKVQFLNLLDEAEELLRREVLDRQLALTKVFETRRKIWDAEERDMRIHCFIGPEGLRLESTIKPPMGLINVKK